MRVVDPLEVVEVGQHQGHGLPEAIGARSSFASAAS